MVIHKPASQLSLDIKSASTLISDFPVSRNGRNKLLTCAENFIVVYHSTSFPGGATAKEPACQCRRHKRPRFDPCIRKIPWEGHDNPLQYSCLENPMDRGACWATVLGLQRVGYDWNDLVCMHPDSRPYRHFGWGVSVFIRVNLRFPYSVGWEGRMGGQGCLGASMQSCPGPTNGRGRVIYGLLYQPALLIIANLWSSFWIWSLA